MKFCKFVFIALTFAFSFNAFARGPFVCSDLLERGDRLDLSKKFLSDADLIRITKKLGSEDTSKITHIDLSFNPGLTRESTDRFFQLFPNATHLNLINVPVSPHKLRVIADSMPRLNTLRLSFVDGDDFYMLEDMPNLRMLDLSSASVRSSRQTVAGSEELFYPSVSLSHLNDIFRYHQTRITTIMLPRLNMANDEGIKKFAAQANVRLIAPPTNSKVELVDCDDVVSNRGMRVLVNGVPKLFYFPGFVLPREGKAYEQSELAYQLGKFLRLLAKEKVEAYIVGAFEFSPNIIYGDIMYRRQIDGQMKLFSLRNALEYLHFGEQATTHWKTHLLKEKHDFVKTFKTHTQLRERDTFNRTGPISPKR